MSTQTVKIITLSIYLYIATQACLAFQKIASGTGIILNQYSPAWGSAFIFIILFSIFLLSIIILIFWKPATLEPISRNFINIREKLGRFTWFIAVLLFLFPGWFLQYTAWGLVFHDIQLRLLLWGFVVVGITFFLTKGSNFFNWNIFISALIFTTTEFIMLQALLYVNDYPFSLGWSEGNRMWDYSMMFGKELYDYPPEQPVFVLIDIGRQFIGGFPFLFSNVSIEFERFWIGLTQFVPYLLLGFTLFRFFSKKPYIWLLSMLWVLMFLKQGSMHPPLLISGTVVALLWRSPLWFSLPLIAITGYLTEESRFTWIFAPGMWLGMLELIYPETPTLTRHTWIRALSLGLTGIAGGYFGDKIVGILQGNAKATVAISIDSITGSATAQPLLWYRLLPNATYGIGILAGLIIVTLPLISLMFYLIYTKKIKFNNWQSLSIIGCLSAFLMVGIIVSTKIGGGGDLHNLDMFMIGLIFVGAIMWYRLEGEFDEIFINSPVNIRIIFILMIIIPGIQSLSSLRTYEYTGNPSWLFTLTDTKFIKDLDLLPSHQIAEESLQIIQQEINLAKQNGEVLFIDQRQLLTFGYIKDVAFVPEYEKKILMNEALSSNAAYFAPFYKDLANKRFSLIISEPLRNPIRDSTYQFGEENNAWVTWVSTPILCYYEEKILLKEVGVQLLIPKEGTVDCTSQLP